jgi:hypothetical protein
VEPLLAALEGKLPNTDLRALAGNVSNELTALHGDLGEVSSRLRWLVEQEESASHNWS